MRQVYSRVVYRNALQPAATVLLETSGSLSKGARSQVTSRITRNTRSTSEERSREYTGSCNAALVASAPGQAAAKALNSGKPEQTSTCVVSKSTPRRIARRLVRRGSEV